MEETKAKIGIKKIAQIGMMSALAAILMWFEFSPPLVPDFLKLDFSEVPVMIGAFAMGPWAGMLIELVKILLKLVMQGTQTMGIGELASFLIGCALCMPAGMIYRRNRTKKGALAGMAAGTVLMTIVGCFLNAFLLLPVYANAFNVPIDILIEAGSRLNAAIIDLRTFVLFMIAPFNLLKGTLISAVVLLIYKKVSPVLKAPL